MADPWAIDAVSGAPAYAAVEARLGTVVPHVAATTNPIGVRPGVRRTTAATDLLVQAQSTPDMTVRVQPGVAIVQGSTTLAQGAYTYTLETTTNLSIGAAHASLTRIDRVCVRIRDASVTGSSNDGAVVVVAGTPGAGAPAIPTDGSYLELAQVTVVALDTAIGSGDITDKRVYTAASGGMIPWTGTAPAGMPAGQPNVDLGSATAKAYVYTGSVNRRLLDDTMGQGLWFADVYVSGNLVTGATTEWVLFTRTVNNLTVGRVYHLKCVAPTYNESVNGTTARLRIKDAGAGYYADGEFGLLPNAGFPVNLQCETLWIATSTSITLRPTITLGYGGGSLCVFGASTGPFLLMITDVSGGGTVVVT